MSSDNAETVFDPCPRPPKFQVPAGACDSHFHVFVHAPTYPFSPLRGYTPAPATNTDYRRLMEALGLQRAVLVHPTPYGTDNALLRDLLRDNPNYRGIAVIDAGVADADLQQLQAAGVRGIRVTTAFDASGAALSSLETLADRIAPLGWHVQLHLRGSTLPDVASRVLALPTPIVFDHMGGLGPSDHPRSPAFETLVDLLGTGRVWVKLSSAYRKSAEGPPYRDTIPLARALVEAAPDRLVWGSNWPHPHLKGIPMPNDGDLLGLLADWAPDERVRRKILVDNPIALYGFPKVSA